MTKKETRILFLEGKHYLVICNIPVDYGKEEIHTAVLADKVVRVVATKNLTGPMDEQVWMDLTPHRLPSEENYRLNNLYKMKNIWHDNMSDEDLLAWMGEEKEKYFPQSTSSIKIGKEAMEVVEVDGKYYIHSEKKCVSCGLTMHGTRQVYKKGDEFVSPQMFVPDPQFKGACPSKFKSKSWLCAAHAVNVITDEVKGEYKGTGVTIPAPKKRPVAVVTDNEYHDLKTEVKDLKNAIKALLKKSYTVAELEVEFWNLADSADSADLGAIAKFLRGLKKGR